MLKKIRNGREVIDLISELEYCDYSVGWCKADEIEMTIGFDDENEEVLTAFINKPISGRDRIATIKLIPSPSLF